jgi:two-component system response regulator HydG
VTARILVVDDDATMCQMLVAHLSKRGYEVVTCTNGADAFERLRADDHDVVITDLNMRGMNGLELCERVVSDRPDIPVLVITAFGRMESAIAAMRVGAYDFIPKPFAIDHLVVALERAIQHRRLRAEVVRLRRVAQTAEVPREFVGDSPAMQRIYGLLARVRDSTAPVLITGESGTGKELVARALHDGSARHGGAFVAVNCAAVPEALLESELFGHVRGAFTDARTARTGLFVQASGGTLFLDEIGELPLALQPKLLRALQELTVRPIGSDAEVKFDARIVTATNLDLETAVADKRFREDLYYRINVVQIELPPLRARGNDILQLAQRFLTRASGPRAITGLSAACAERLLAYPWPGNVRELENCIARAVAVAQYEQLTVEDLPEKIRGYRGGQLILDAAEDPAHLLRMDEVERRYIAHVLDRVSGNKSLAAKLLGFDRTTLYRKLARYGLAEATDEPAE